MGLGFDGTNDLTSVLSWDPLDGSWQTLVWADTTMQLLPSPDQLWRHIVNSELDSIHIKKNIIGNFGAHGQFAGFKLQYISDKKAFQPYCKQ